MLMFSHKVYIQDFKYILNHSFFVLAELTMMFGVCGSFNSARAKRFSSCLILSHRRQTGCDLCTGTLLFDRIQMTLLMNINMVNVLKVTQNFTL